MSLFQKFINNLREAQRAPIQNSDTKNSRQSSDSSDSNKEEHVEKIESLRLFIEKLLKEDHYVAKSEFLSALQEYQGVLDFFETLKQADMLESFCKKNGLEDSEIELTMDEFHHLETLVDQHNDVWVNQKLISERQYFDVILREVDPNIILDEDQRRVVLTDEDYCLVIAGAGAGKTTTVAAKVRYLVEKQGIDPTQIMVVSFTNKAVNELQDRINISLRIPCPICTFHSVGNAIIKKNSPEEKLNIVEPTKMYFVIRDYFRNSVLQKENMVNNLIMFFATYFDAPYEGDNINAFFNQIAKANYSTMRSDLDRFQREIIDTRTKKSITIQNEFLRSHEEVEIANFLYLNNLDYEYEPIYKYDIELSRKPYTPDFVIRQGDHTAYIEHFGISEDGKNDRYSDAQLTAYKKAINDKVKLHRDHKTELIYTFSTYCDRRPLIQHLKEALEEHGFLLQPRSKQEVLEMIVAGEENRYIRKLLNLICRFITNFKVNGYTEDDFNRMYHSTQNVRTRLFLEICQDSYLEYQRWLTENKAVDFQDMINESVGILEKVGEMKQKLDFQYVIVDEYQDISRQRFDLTKKLSEVTSAKIIAVGDDWQSIYAFSGSDITLFTKFAETMGYAKMLKIVHTYRNSQDVIDIAGNFIQKNSAQIQKNLISLKHINDPVIIYTYDSRYKGANGDRRSGKNYAQAYAVQKAIEQIIEFAKEEKHSIGKILLLGRYGFDGDQLEKSGLFEYNARKDKLYSVKYNNLDITFMTAHSSKGLGYDNVIIVNGKNEQYGFPSKIEDDPVLGFVVKEDQSIAYAEERRLFYVAMTRTKNRVFIVAPKQNPSEFLLELKHDYKNVELRGEWNEAPPEAVEKKRCPICGYPMQLKYKPAYGLRLYICTNDPEVCGFMTNEYKAGKLSIMKCNQCHDGYLIVKPSKDKKDYFLGCTNYKKDGSGCNNTVSRREYYRQMNFPYEPIANEPSPKIQIGDMLDSTKVGSNKASGHSVPNVNGYREDYVEIKKSDLPKVEYQGKDLNDIVFACVEGLQRISTVHYYGESVFINCMLGSVTPKILHRKLNELPIFGSLSDLTYDEMRVIVSWMLNEHFMLKTKGEYPVLHPTWDGIHYDQTMTVQKLRKLKKYLEK